MLANDFWRLACQSAMGALVFALPAFPLNRAVTAFFVFSLAGLALMSSRAWALAPWALAQIRRPRPWAASAEAAACLFASFTVLFYLAGSEHHPIHFAAGYAAISAAWMMIHSLYSHEYAVQHYRDGRGLAFPECQRPGWTEFYYQGLCIGSCFQTSDTLVVTSAMRRLIALHAFVSFSMSISIVAMTFSLVSNLL